MSRIFKSWRLFDIYLFCDVAIQKCTLDIHLIDKKAHERCKCQKESSVKLGRNKGEEILSEEHNVQEEDTTHHFAPDVERKSDETEEVNIEEKEASNVKSG
ncbi:hypothetical protein Tco_0333779, partial [Tanacetum coccineum]